MHPGVDPLRGNRTDVRHEPADRRRGNHDGVRGRTTAAHGQCGSGRTATDLARRRAASVMLAVRDLSWRRRRFLIAFLATGIVFTLALLMTGIKAGLDREPGRTVNSFHADRWLLPLGVSAPFGGPSPFPASSVNAVRTTQGVRRADPVAILGATVGTRNVNVIGVLPGGVGAPSASVSRFLAEGLAVADDSLGVRVEDRLHINGVSLQVGGLTHGMTYFGGQPTVVVSLRQAQQMALGGQPLATAIVTRGIPRRIPTGFVALSNAEVRDSLARPVAGADKVITLIRALMWVVAAGIIAAILYLSALEQLSDFAVLKAIGVAIHTLLVTLVLQALTVSIASGLFAVALTALLAPATGLAVVLSPSSYLTLFLVAIAVGTLGSLLALRRVAAVDPALAFEG
jgi:putative ABC transport system permease protein